MAPRNGTPGEAVLTARRVSLDPLPFAAARADPLPALHSFANGLRKDHDTVLVGLTLPYSSGRLEGKNCKMIKRLM